MLTHVQIKDYKTKIFTFTFPISTFRKFSLFTILSSSSQLPSSKTLANFKKNSEKLIISFAVYTENTSIMAHAEGSTSKTLTHDEPINFSKEVQSGHQFIVEPDVKEAEDKIWKTQVIISCPNSPHAFLGPFPDVKEDPEKLSVVFPNFEERSPLIFTKGPYDLSFLKSKFRTEPKIENNEKYFSWLDKMEKQNGQF